MAADQRFGGALPDAVSLCPAYGGISETPVGPMERQRNRASGFAGRLQKRKRPPEGGPGVGRRFVQNL
jgi:hypothetical protein